MHNIQTVIVKPISVKSSVTFRPAILANLREGFNRTYINVMMYPTVRNTPNY